MEDKIDQQYQNDLSEIPNKKNYAKYIILAVICILLLVATRFLIRYSKHSQSITNTSQNTVAPSTPSKVSAENSQTSGIVLGSYIEPNKKAYQTYISEVGKKPAISFIVQYWDSPKSAFNPTILDTLYDQGIMPELNWQPSVIGSSANPNQPNYNWQAIISGEHDGYITKFAQDAANYHKVFYIRMMHEMNGPWYPWGYNANGNTNIADYKKAWQHIVAIFRAQGASNVRFVWCVATTPGLFNKVDISQLYPGDNYVDVIAMDGYNNNDSRIGWRSIFDVFSPTYEKLITMSQKPIFINEVGSVEDPNDLNRKAQWIKDGLLTTIPQQFPKVSVVMWFDRAMGPNGQNWAIDSSPNALNAYKQVVESPLYQGVLTK